MRHAYNIAVRRFVTYSYTHNGDLMHEMAYEHRRHDGIPMDVYESLKACNLWKMYAFRSFANGCKESDTICAAGPKISPMFERFTE